ncbi:MAG TPA: RNA-binding protein [Chitinophagales bacterium]|jgi:RNA recognition motif-containing protein|nr:RNA-binding protein [Chitinophagales bacterium]MCB0512514.1 RNA-binding protein [Bacteroidota bacterium]MCB9075332.1 RNA-binding protein [Chitinophagales bacterium]HMU97221.1 RNA-binding protein [Chitinophagales bacterium]HMV02024.1 RNA-binding protein [Chitinophagales bacterium]
MNIYIANINFRTSTEALQQLFENYGEVTSAKIITDRETGRSRGFGFVEMSNDEEAQKAIDELNGSEFDGKALSVNVAKPKENNSRGSYGGGNSNYKKKSW